MDLSALRQGALPEEGCQKIKFWYIMTIFLVESMTSLTQRRIVLAVATLVALWLPFSQSASQADRTGKRGVPSLRLRSQAAVAVDIENRVILYDKNPTVQRSIASITKLMSVLVFLELTPDLDLPTIILHEDRTQSTSSFPVGNSYHLIDLLHGVLMSSDNRATRALVRSTGLGEEEFVNQMNQKATEIGLRDTHFADPTGLSPENVSSALDCVKLIETALGDSLIAAISTKREHRCRSLLKKRLVHLYNTNRLLSNSNLQVLVGKTGFIRSSGYCLATCVGDQNGKKIVFVVLGAPSNTTRFQEMYKLIRWTSQNYKLAIS